MHLINVPTCLQQIHGEKVLAEFPFAQDFVKGNGGVYLHVSSVKLLRTFSCFRGTGSRKLRPASTTIHRFYLANFSSH